MPAQARRRVGFALRFAQAGVLPDHAKPLKGFKGTGVVEIIGNHDGNTYLAVYTVKLNGVVYVLHCFQKKSKRGIAIPLRELALIRQRLHQAEFRHAQRAAAS